MAEQRIRLDEIVDGQSITVDPLTGKLKSTPINSVATGVGILDPIRFFARPTSAVTPPAGVTVAEAHQGMLGHGKEFTLSMFGWSSGDIYPAFQAAINAAKAAGGGTVLLPAGQLTCSAGVTVPTCWSTGIHGAGIMIRGAGMFVTTITLTTDPAIFLHFDGFGAEANFVIGGGLEDLSIHSVGGYTPTTGTGVKYSASIICSTRNVHLLGFGLGLQYADVGANNCQIQQLSNIGVYFCAVGMEMNSLAQFTATQTKWNGCGIGAHIKAATGAFVGGLIQGIATTGILIDTGASSVSFDGTIYYEGGMSDAVIRADGTGTSITLGMHSAFDCAANPGILLSVANCTVTVDGNWRTSGITTGIKARNMLHCLISGQSGLASFYDFDAVSAKATTWVSRDGIAIGTAFPTTQSSSRLIVRAGAYDGSYYDSVPGTNFMQILAGIYGEMLRACWHAALGIELNSVVATAEIDAWLDQVNNIRMLPAGNPAIYAADGSNFRGRPVVHSSQSAARGMRVAGLSVPILSTGEAGCLISFSRWKANANGAALFGTGVNAVSDNMRVGDNATNHIATMPGGAITGPAFGTGQHVWKLSSDGATTSALTIDGTDYTVAAGAGLGANQTAIAIGCNGSGANAFSDAAHACLIVLRGSPSANQWAATRTLLTREFG